VVNYVGIDPQWVYHFRGSPYPEHLAQWEEYQELHRMLIRGESKGSRELIHESMTKILTEMARSAK
jgi:hypothetical protein